MVNLRCKEYKGYFIIERNSDGVIDYTFSPYRCIVKALDLAHHIGIQEFELGKILNKYVTNIISGAYNVVTPFFSTIHRCIACLEEILDRLDLGDHYFKVDKVGPILITETREGFILMLTNGRILQDIDIGFDYLDLVDFIEYYLENPFDRASWFRFPSIAYAKRFCVEILEHLELTGVDIKFEDKYYVTTTNGIAIAKDKSSTLKDISDLVKKVRKDGMKL